MGIKENNPMLKTIVSTTTAIVTSLIVTGSASAEQARNVHVQDVYTEIRQNTPYTTQECVMVRNSGNAASGALTGMILGGLLGKGATGDDGGAAAGAVIGGIIGADRGGQRGGGLEERCTEVTRYRSGYQTVYDYSIITFTYEGRAYEQTFIK
jgi:outer membrane lipoprotein SlyB